MKNSLFHSTRGQGGAEYLFTYWWAILIVLIVGVIILGTNMLSPSGNPTAGMSGFTVLKPLEWECSSSSHILQVAMVNVAGVTIKNLTMLNPEGDCESEQVLAGSSVICYADFDCGVLGTRFSAELVFSLDTSKGMDRQSSGEIWGPAS
jgi:hypothetical protein